MGMSAAQLEFLALTDRKHTIGRKLQRLSSDKMALTRDMQAVTREYQAALSSKTMKWSNNSGVTYSDISYSTLMRPNEYNAKSPVLITDCSGRIVLDEKYAKYAKMLDEEGGSWSGAVREKILAGLTGIPQQTIADYDKLYNDSADAADNYNKLLEDYDKWVNAETAKTGNGGGSEYLTTDKLKQKLGSVNNVDLTRKNSTYTISSEEDLKTFINGIKNNLGKYFVDDEEYLGVTDKTNFYNACDSVYGTYKSLMSSNDAGADKLRESYGMSGGSGDFKINVSSALELIMGAYLNNGGSCKTNKSSETTYLIRDPESSKWQTWYNGFKTLKDSLDSAKATYDSSVDSANQVLTADQESMLKYYDLLFQAVADNGWTTDSQISDSEYLSQMFQNNNYYITTIEEEPCADGERIHKYNYDTNAATSYKNIFMVNDSDARDEALVEYEYKKGIINAKESRIDTQMKNYETEQSAIQKMMESLEQVKNDEIERVFNLWG